MIEALSEQKAGNMMVADLEIKPEFYCTFSSCVKHYSSKFEIALWKMNIRSINCTYEGESN